MQPLVQGVSKLQTAKNKSQHHENFIPFLACFYIFPLAILYMLL